MMGQIGIKMPRRSLKKEEIRQILEHGWADRREKQKERNKKSSEGTKEWKAKTALVSKREAELGRPLTEKEYKTLTGYLKRDLDWMKFSSINKKWK